MGFYGCQADAQGISGLGLGTAAYDMTKDISLSFTQIVSLDEIMQVNLGGTERKYSNSPSPRILNQGEVGYYRKEIAAQGFQKPCVRKYGSFCFHDSVDAFFYALLIEKDFLHRNGLFEWTIAFDKPLGIVIQVGNIPCSVDHEQGAVHVFDQLAIDLCGSKSHKTVAHDCITHGRHPEQGYDAGYGTFPFGSREEVY